MTQNCSHLTFIAVEYLYIDCNISSNNIPFCFLKTEEKLFHLSISLFKIVFSLLFSSLKLEEKDFTIFFF
jgi:hypothetical protein